MEPTLESLHSFIDDPEKNCDVIWNLVYGTVSVNVNFCIIGLGHLKAYVM
jgi:hypothetical protein